MVSDIGTKLASNSALVWIRCAGSCERIHSKPSQKNFCSDTKSKKRGLEALWRDFFSNTSQWWDHRPEKINPRFPDFKHKQTGEALWLADARNPPWVQAELAAIPPGKLQSNAFAWVQRLKRYVKAGLYMKTMEVFYQMQQGRICPDSWTFLPVLNACAGLGALEEGKRVHTQIIQVGCESNVYVATGLVDMYAKCGSIEDAWSVFRKMSKHDVVTWTAMILGYVKSGQGLKALELFQCMQQEGVEPNAVTFVGALNACASVAALEEGRRVHKVIFQKDCASDVYVGSALVDMYAKCGSIEDAWSVFKNMQEHDVVTWSVVIREYVKSGQVLKAMKLYQIMQQEGVQPDAVTFVGVLNACASIGALEEGRRVHDEIIRRNCESDVYVGNCLVDMYAKCGSMEDAWNVFNKIGEHDVVTWSAMIGGYVKSGQSLKAIGLFQKMQQSGVEPDATTFVGVLNACASVAALGQGRRVHEQIIGRGWGYDVYIGSGLVDMYAKCGSIEDALNVFNKMPKRDVVTWSAMILGYVKSGRPLKAMDLFQKMKQEGVEPDAATFVGVLNACASVAALEEGRRVHEEIIGRGCHSDVYVGNCLVDMYAKCGSMEDAWRVFNEMGERDVVTWSAMIAACVKSGNSLMAMKLFRDMQQEGVEPDAITFVGVLTACASVAALDEGRRVHGQIISTGCESDVFVGSSLVDMYAKCGSIEDAFTAFKTLPTQGVVAWNAMIGAYAVNGHAEKAIGLFEEMGGEGLDIDGITFTSLLSACSHGGLVNEGLHYFESMVSCFNICPTAEHYACMVDLLGRAGRLQEAEDLTKKMRFNTNVSVWMSLLGACRIHGNIEIAERAAKQCWELDPGNASAHMLLWNAYSAAGKWDSSAALERERLKRKQQIVPGGSWIEVNSVVHFFVVDDKDHPQIVEIHAELQRLCHQVEAGYVPDGSFVILGKRNRSYLCCHSEKLAIAYGLISTPAGTPLRIKTNMPICPDCHGLTKFIANMVGRIIIVKDANRFHRFEGGICSCNDYF